MPSSWFSVSVHLQSGGGEIFRGIFKVDDSTHIISEFYQTINGNTDFTNNRLIQPGGLNSNDNVYNSPEQYFTGNGVGVLTDSLIVFGSNITSLLLYYEYISPIMMFPASYEYIRFYVSGGYVHSNGYTYTITPYSNPTPNYPCFLEGSKILCFKDNSEVYLPIESLKRGDFVKTLLNDYVPIKVIGSSVIKFNPSLELHPKDKLFVCSKDNYPELFEDLVLTGAHSILVNELTEEQKKKTIEILRKLYVTDHKYRLMAYIDDRTVECNYKTDQTIWHLALENENYYGNYGIYANGLLVESVSIRYMNELSNMVIKD
jgi:hypothetical protein